VNPPTTPRYPPTPRRNAHQVNVAKCLQRVCDPRFYDGKHGEIGRSREALWREIVHTEFGVMEGEMRHDDMEGRLCDFDNYSDMDHHIYHFCSEVAPTPTPTPTMCKLHLWLRRPLPAPALC